MNLKSVIEIARREMPKIDVEMKDTMLRHEVVSYLDSTNNIGIELGVAQGIYSKRMIKSGKFKLFWGVDVYGDIHNTKEYQNALKYIGLDSNYRLLRMTFEEAGELFEDNHFDFIYIDGFAHTGEEGGKTLIEWHKKLKVGGILAGDDYHEAWPLVQWAVNDFAVKSDSKICVTGGKENELYCTFPTWFTRKTKNVNVKENKLLVKLSLSEKAKVHKQRARLGSKYWGKVYSLLHLAKRIIKNILIKKIRKN